MSPLHQLALALLPGVGPVTARRLLEHYGSEEAVFRESLQDLEKLPGIGKKLARSFRPPVISNALKMAEAELRFMEKTGIRSLFCHDSAYPRRLKNCHDAPLVLFFRGKEVPDHPRVLSIVGSRKATGDGKMLCSSLVEGLRPYGPVIVSGLAYGIDVTAHEAALKNGLTTIGVLGHGMNSMYPAAHYGISREMEQQGGLLSEFFHDAPAVPENFPKRNRIVAGLADATIVVEAGKKGGALITADIAASYDREVFAFPGRLRDKNSEGCIRLIRDHRAQLITGAEDVAWYLGWEKTGEEKHPAQATSPKLSEAEQNIMQLISENPGVSADQLLVSGKMSREKLFPVLINLEIAGFIKNIPGNRYILH